jgi:hypothetical protein
MRWAGRVACKKRCEIHKNSVWKTEKGILLARWEDNIKMYLEKQGERVWIEVICFRVAYY